MKCSLWSSFGLGLILILSTTASGANWAERLRGGPPAGDADGVTLNFGAEHAMLTQTLRNLLLESSDAAIAALGQPGALQENPRPAIPLPGILDDARSLLQGLGLSPQTDRLEQGFRQIAEVILPRAQPIVQRAIETLVIEDARALMVGAPDSATRYLRRMQGEAIAADLLPLTRETLAGRDESRLLSELLDPVAVHLPRVSEIEDLDLATYLNARILDAYFGQLGAEETRIRAAP